ncbi:hypothetical protein BJ165DRAFT_1553884, partial [Panaeolus papilionaceus]
PYPAGNQKASRRNDSDNYQSLAYKKVRNCRDKIQQQLTVTVNQSTWSPSSPPSSSLLLPSLVLLPCPPMPQRVSVSSRVAQAHPAPPVPAMDTTTPGGRTTRAKPPTQTAVEDNTASNGPETATSSVEKDGTPAATTGKSTTAATTSPTATATSRSTAGLATRSSSTTSSSLMARTIPLLLLRRRDLSTATEPTMISSRRLVRTSPRSTALRRSSSSGLFATPRRTPEARSAEA